MFSSFFYYFCFVVEFFRFLKDRRWICRVNAFLFKSKGLDEMILEKVDGFEGKGLFLVFLGVWVKKIWVWLWYGELD